MKKIFLHSILLMAVWLISASLPSCQQAILEEEQTESSGQDAGARNGQAEQSDSVTVTPEINVGDWEGNIDADFDFGGEENE